MSKPDNPLCVCSATSPTANPYTANPTGEMLTHTQTNVVLMYAYTHTAYYTRTGEHASLSARKHASHQHAATPAHSLHPVRSCKHACSTIYVHALLGMQCPEIHALCVLLTGVSNFFYVLSPQIDCQ